MAEVALDDTKRKRNSAKQPKNGEKVSYHGIDLAQFDLENALRVGRVTLCFDVLTAPGRR